MAAMTAIGPARGVPLQAARLPLRVRLGGIRRQPGPSHALDRAVFVLVRRVAADADGADGGAARVQDEHGAGDGDELTARSPDDGGDEIGAVAQALSDGARRNAHAERAASLALSDLHSQQPATVLALEGDQVTTRVEHGDRQRQEILGPCGAEGAVDDRASRSEEHTSELQSPCNLVCRLLLEKKKNTNKHSERN